MFTTPSAVPTAAAVVRPSFQIINTTSSSPTNPSWRSTTPSVVSIINGTSPALYIATTQPSTTTTANLLRPCTQTVRLVSPALTLINNSNTILTGQVPILTTSINNNNSQPGICLETSVLGRLATPINDREEQNCSLSNDINLDNNSQDPEIELFVNNVVCSFALSCKLNLRKIAMEGANVIYKRDNAMVLMKIRNPNCSANIWSSGKVTVTGTTSEDDAYRGARRVARCIQRLGYKVKFRNFRVVNCLATCSMPWPLDIIKLSHLYRECVSYEPEIHPGATVRLDNRAVLKVFTTGSVTLTAPSVEVVNTAVNEFYPQLFECRKMSRDVEQRKQIQ